MNISQEEDVTTTELKDNRFLIYSFCSLLLASMLFTSRIVIPYIKSSSRAGSYNAKTAPRAVGSKAASTAVAPVAVKKESKKNQ